MSKVLVIGGAGYIGSHTVKQLQKNDFEVVVVDDLTTGYLNSLQPDVRFYNVNILDLTQLRKVFEEHSFEAVFHFAAKLSVPESFEKFDEYFFTNVVGTQNLLQMCREFNIKRFIFSSTAAVYGDSADAHVDENAFLKPQNPYGTTKKMAEDLLQSFALTTPNFKYQILRYFNVAGAEIDSTNGPRNLKSGQLILNLCQSAMTHKRVQIFGQKFNTVDGTAVRDYIHVVDLAEAHIAALQCLSQSQVQSGVWNCGYGRGYSVLQVVQAFEKANQVKFNIEFAPARIGDPAQIIASNDRILKQSNWKYKFNNIELICNSTFNWIKNEQR